MSSKRGKGSIGKQQPQRSIVTNILFTLLGMALMGGISFLKPGFQGAKLTNAPATANGTNRTRMWGELEYQYFTLGQPDQYLPDWTNALPAPAWYFERTAPAELSNFFNSVEMAATVRDMLLDARRWQAADNAVLVAPPSEVLLNMGRPTRERIYARLASSPINMPQAYPFRFRPDGFDEWFAQSSLAADKLDLIRTLIYTNRGGAMCLADIHALQEKLTPEEFKRVFESLYSEPCLFLSLRVRPESDVQRLAQYWGVGGRQSEVLTLLKSVARSPGGGSISIAHLLPPFARSRLYTFLRPTQDPATSGQDCFWTALNFFRSEREAEIPLRTGSLDALMKQYAETLEPPRLGDVVMFLENGKAMHASVYIADDVVFTKNGVNYHQPWVLMKLNDLLPRYTTDQQMSVVVFRRKAT